MRILFIAPRFHTNQVEIVNGLLNDNHHVYYFVQRINKLENHKQITPMIMKKSLLWMIIRFLYSLFHSSNEVEDFEIRFFIPSLLFGLIDVSRVKPDMVIFRDRNLSTLILTLCCRILRIKKLILYNQSELSKPIEKNKIIKRIFYPRVRITPVIEKEYNFNNLMCQIPKKHDYFVPFISSDKHYSYMKTRMYQANDKINILIIGKYRDYKNLFLILESLILIKNIDIYKIRIIGQCLNESEKSYFKQLQNKIIEKSLQDVVQLIVNVPFENMNDYYTMSDVLLLTSKKELASVSIIEAMSYGLIPISTHKNGTASYINGCFGYIFKSNDAQDLAHILIELTRINIDLYGLSNLEYFKKNYTYTQYKHKMNLMLKNEFNENI